MSLSSTNRMLRCAIAAAVGCVAGNALHSESLVIKLINGKNSKPLSHFRVYVILGDEKSGQSLDAKTDKLGEIRIDTKAATTIQVRPIGVLPCGEQPVGAPERNYSVSSITQYGVVTTNDCGSYKPKAKPGSVIYIAKPASAFDLFRL